MKSMLSGALLAATALTATPAMASEATALDTMGKVLATASSADQITTKCKVYVDEIERRKAELAGETGPATIEGTLTRYDAIVGLINAGLGEFELYKQVMADQERRDAGGNCTIELSKLGSELSLSRPIYERIRAIDSSGADAATAWYLKRTLGDFERAGVALDDDKRGQVQALNEEIARVGDAFDTNIANARKVIKVKPEDLAGLPQDYIDAHKPGADGLVEISTDTPDYQPVMAYAESDALRRQLSEAYMQRAYPANDVKLKELFFLRQQLAELLGRPNYATLVLEDKMVDSPAKVQSLITEMADAARPAAERDYAKSMAVLKTIEPDADKIEFWQINWLKAKVQKKYYDYDPQEARKYFAYNDMRDGILKLTEDLFGVQIRPWDTPKWDPLVETYEIVDHGKVLGRFYFDSHPRPGKYTHANMIPIYPGTADQPPVAALVMNLPTGDHKTGLMEHRDVETFLHEYGHMLHGMFGGTQEWFSQTGVTTEWDFVEAPSQMLENWVYDYDTLAKFAKDKDGKVIPRKLVEKMNKARLFNLGIEDMIQLGYANISLQFHQNPVPSDLGAATRAYYGKYALIPMPDYVQMQDAFGHLNGYSAIYYTYRWSKVISDDLFTRFQKDGLRNAATAAEYRAKILAKGGTEPAANLVHDFLGRDISLDAYKANMAKDQ